MKSSPFLWRFLGGFAAGALLVIGSHPDMVRNVIAPAAQAAPTS